MRRGQPSVVTSRFDGGRTCHDRGVGDQTAGTSDEDEPEAPADPRSYRREAGGLLTHARFVADSLRPDPFQAWIAELATNDAQPIPVAAPEQTHAAEASVGTGKTARTRKRA